MKALVGSFNQEKALVGAFSVIVKTGYGTDGSFYSTSPDLHWTTLHTAPLLQPGNVEWTRIVVADTTCRELTFPVWWCAAALRALHQVSKQEMSVCCEVRCRNWGSNNQLHPQHHSPQQHQSLWRGEWRSVAIVWYSSSSPWLSSWPLLGAAACQHNTPAHTKQLDGIVKLSWLSTVKCLYI